MRTGVDNWLLHQTIWHGGSETIAGYRGLARCSLGRVSIFFSSSSMPRPWLAEYVGVPSGNYQVVHERRFPIGWPGLEQNLTGSGEARLDGPIPLPPEAEDVQMGYRGDRPDDGAEGVVHQEGSRHHAGDPWQGEEAELDELL